MRQPILRGSSRARDGEEVVLVNEGHAVAKLIAVSGKSAPREPRILARLEGQMKVPDDFDAPLPDDLLDLFYKGPIFPSDPTTESTSTNGSEHGRDETRDGS